MLSQSSRSGTIVSVREDIDRILIPARRIEERIRELADQIVADHLHAHGFQRGLTLVAVLRGAVIFCADLMRQISINARIDFLTVSGYPGSSTISKGATLVSQQLGDLQDQHVILVDDILDSGGTLELLVPQLQSFKPAQIHTCVLLRKNKSIAAGITPDYVGFDIEDEFVVGYGLDYNGYYRNFPSVATLTAKALQRNK